MRFSRPLLWISVTLILLAGLYWFLLDPVYVDFLVRPGGPDVKVRIDGHQQIATVTDADHNLYAICLGLHPGRHTIVISKPGYVSVTHVINLKRGESERYLELPPLRKKSPTTGDSR